MTTKPPVVMLLCAGRGERLRPLTYTIPKVLCPLQGKPLLIHHLEQLSAQGLTQIIINHAYMGDKIRQLLGNGHHLGVDICYAPEPPGGLETGGGIINMLPLVDTEHFITVNGDIYVEYAYRKLILQEITGVAHTVLVANPKHNPQGDFTLLDNITLANRALKPGQEMLTFAGITKYRRAIFHGIAPGRFRIPSLLRTWVEQGLVSGEVLTGRWYDIGTPARLREAEQALTLSAEPG